MYWVVIDLLLNINASYWLIIAVLLNITVRVMGLS
jgi:hypothetical protein